MKFCILVYQQQTWWLRILRSPDSVGGLGSAYAVPPGLTHTAGLEGPRGPHPPFWCAVTAGAWAPRVLSLCTRAQPASPCGDLRTVSHGGKSRNHTSHKASPDSRAGKWAPALMGREAKSHCKEGMDTD